MILSNERLKGKKNKNINERKQTFKNEFVVQLKMKDGVKIGGDKVRVRSKGI